MGGSILHRTSSLADAIAMLIVELERQFMHMHPCIQRIFLEFSNIEHSSVKRAATIFLAHEFRFIIKEAKEIFAHYRVDACCNIPKFSKFWNVNNKLKLSELL